MKITSPCLLPPLKNNQSSKNNNSPPAGFTIANSSVNTGISLGSLLFSIATFAYTYPRDQREKKDKEKWEKEMKDQIRILEERVFLSLDQLCAFTSDC